MKYSPNELDRRTIDSNRERENMISLSPTTPTANYELTVSFHSHSLSKWSTVSIYVSIILIGDVYKNAKRNGELMTSHFRSRLRRHVECETIDDNFSAKRAENTTRRIASLLRFKTTATSRNRVSPSLDEVPSVVRFFLL